jgi:hypothetical protein
MTADTWLRRLPPALVTDMPVLAVLLLTWVTIAVFWAHLIAGLALIGVIGMHLRTRRGLPLRRVRMRRRVAYVLFLVAATTMAVTGVLRWAGVPAQYLWHGGVSYLVLGLVVVHLWSVRRALRARIRRVGAVGVQHG